MKQRNFLLLTFLLCFGKVALLCGGDMGEQDLEMLKQRGLAAINRLLLDRDQLLRDREKLLKECQYLRNRLDNFDGDEEAIRLRKMLGELERILAAGEDELIEAATGTMSELQELRREKEFITQQLVQQRILARRAQRTGLMVVGAITIVGLSLALYWAVKKLGKERAMYDQRYAKIVMEVGLSNETINRIGGEQDSLYGQLTELNEKYNQLAGVCRLAVDQLNNKVQKTEREKNRLSSRSSFHFLNPLSWLKGNGNA